jgi:alcohol dehydrogenase (cytochrome c)
MNHRIPGIAALLFLASTCAAQVTTQDLVKPDPKNWLSYSGSYDSQRHTALKQIDISNVASLGPKWIFHVPGSQTLEGVPVVINDIMYVPQASGVIALDARSGRLIWQYQRVPGSRGHNRGLAVYGNKVFTATSDAYLVALDTRNGGVIWESKLAGQAVKYQGAAPLLVNGKVIIGVDSAVGGTVDAYDAETGKHVWGWHSIPKPGEKGIETWGGDSWKLAGAPTWLSGSYDPELNLLYWGTGQPDPDFDGDGRPGDNLFGDCMVALDPDTGKLKWYFQFTPHDVHDWDAVEMPVLIDASFKGQPRKLLLQANRNGYYYILDRTNGKFLQGTQFVKKMTWSSGLTEDGRPVVIPGSAPTVQGNKVCPSTAGATNWPSPAYSPDTRYFYVIVQEGCGLNFKASDNFKPEHLSGYSDSGTSYTESTEEQERWQLFVRALDVSTGKTVWDYEQIGSHHYGPGLLSTAGGVLFAGEQQGAFTALDAKTGKPLWHFNTGDLITASPIAYSAQGNEYVAIMSGTNLLAFGLPEHQ